MTGNPTACSPPTWPTSGSLQDNPPADPRAPQPAAPLPPIRAGARLRIVEGPFAGFDGHAEAVGTRRIKALVRLFGRLTTLDLARSAVRAA
jgi:transcription antitermination factor NusG